MTRSRYDFEEALNRILRTLEGKALTADTPEVITGDVLNKEDAMSDISELLDNSLPGETLTLPTAVTDAIVAGVQHATTTLYGLVRYATTDEANEGSYASSVLSPASHTYAHEFGGIYSTGSSIQAFGAGAWTKVTGTFQADMHDSGDVTGDWNDDRIAMNEAGSYFVQYQMTLFSHGTATDVESLAYLDGVRIGSSYANASISASGTISKISGLGIASVTGSGQYIDLRLALKDANSVTFKSGQLTAVKMVGG